MLYEVITRVELEDGAVLQISPMHPMADGRTFGDLAPADFAPWLDPRNNFV